MIRSWASLGHFFLPLGATLGLLGLTARSGDSRRASALAMSHRDRAAVHPRAHDLRRRRAAEHAQHCSLGHLLAPAPRPPRQMRVRVTAGRHACRGSAPRRAERRQPVGRQPHGRGRDAERRDRRRRARRAPAPQPRAGQARAPRSSSPSRVPELRRAPLERGAVDDRVLGETLERAARQPRRSEGQEDLAVRGGVERHRPPDPVRRAEEEAAVALGEVLDARRPRRLRRSPSRRSARRARRAPRRSARRGRPRRPARRA